MSHSNNPSTNFSFKIEVTARKKALYFRGVYCSLNLPNVCVETASENGRRAVGSPAGGSPGPAQTWAPSRSTARTSCCRGRCNSRRRCQPTGTWSSWTRSPTTWKTPYGSLPAAEGEGKASSAKGRKQHYLIGMQWDIKSHWWPNKLEGNWSSGKRQLSGEWLLTTSRVRAVWMWGGVGGGEGWKRLSNMTEWGSSDNRPRKTFRVGY